MDAWNRHRQPVSFESNGKNRQDRQEATRRAEQERRAKLEQALEVGLEETFPGSDPVSVTLPPSSPYDRNEARKR
jgi:hypothetical protein